MKIKENGWAFYFKTPCKKYNKTRISIGNQNCRWVELKEALRVQTHAEVPLRIYFGNWDMYN
jgi:hypothetical protein